MKKSDSTTTPAKAGVFAFEGADNMAELSEALKKLAAITPKLNQATDAANAVFRATEDFLSKLGVGIEESVTVTTLETKERDITDEDYEGPNVLIERRETELLLVYGRMFGKVRLGFKTQAVLTHVSTNWEDQKAVEDGDTVAWDQASREWKLNGATRLSELIAAIVKKAEKLANDASASSAELADMLADLNRA